MSGVATLGYDLKSRSYAYEKGGTTVAEHAKKACLANRDIQLTRDSKGRIVVRKPSQKPRALHVYRNVPSVAANLGGGPRVLSKS